MRADSSWPLLAPSAWTLRLGRAPRPRGRKMVTTLSSMSITGLSIDRFDADGRVCETWDQWDNLGFMTQLGLIPETAAAG